MTHQSSWLSLKHVGCTWDKISALGNFYGVCVFMKIDIFQLKWGGLMEAGGGGWPVPVTLGLVVMIPHGLFTPSVLRCWGEYCESSGHYEQGSQLGWLNLGAA